MTEIILVSALVGVLWVVGIVLAALPLLAGVLALGVWVRERLRLPVEHRRDEIPGAMHSLTHGQTHIVENGPRSGPPIVLVHGLTTPSFVFDALIDTLVARGHHVVTYDHFGRGYSDRPPHPQDAAFFRNHLVEVLDAAGVTRPAMLVGYSMGGAVVTDFAARHPDRVERAVLIAPAGMRAELGGLVRRAAIWPVAGDILMHLFYPRLHRRGTDAERELPLAVPNIIERQQDELRYRGFIRAVLSSLRGLLHHQLDTEHRKIADDGTPVTVIWAREDDVIPLAGRDTLAEWNPNAHHVVVDGAGHGLTYTHPKDVLDAIPGPRP